jgi:hypothetical protein
MSDNWIEIFKTTINNPVFKVIILGVYKEAESWEIKKKYRARVTISIYPKGESITETYLFNNYFNTKDEIFDALMPYSEGFNPEYVQTTWVTLIGD